jgi:hypothetical protein
MIIKKIKTIVAVAVLLVIVIWVVDKVPFNKTINHQITANVYENGIAVDKTRLEINGKKSNYIFRKRDGFTGELLIPHVEKTDRADLQTYISWNGEDNVQRIGYYYKGIIKLAEEMGIVPVLLTNNSMTKFAIMLTDYTVIATSDELYELYTKHITWHNDASGVSIVRVNEIPKID